MYGYDFQDKLSGEKSGEGGRTEYSVLLIV